MAESLATRPDNLAEQIAALSTEQLKAELAEGLRVTAAGLLRMALIVQALEFRGEDVSTLRRGLLPYLHQIASGQLLPEIVVRFAGVPSLVSRLGQLPIEDQRRLAAGAAVALLAADGNVTMKDPLTMTAKEAARAFANGRIADPQEQQKLLQSRPRKKPAPQQRREAAWEDDEDRPLMEMVLAMAAGANPRDLAGVINDMIASSPDPDAVFALIHKPR